MWIYYWQVKNCVWPYIFIEAKKIEIYHKLSMYLALFYKYIALEAQCVIEVLKYIIMHVRFHFEITTNSC